MRSFLKVSLLSALTLALPTVLAGQVRVGVRGGLSIATLGGDDAGDVDSRTGLNVGGFLNVPVAGIVGVQLGAGFTEKGSQETELGVDWEFALDYFEVPLLLTLSPPMTGNVGFHFLIGPALSFRASCTASGRQGGVQVSLDCKHPDIGAPLKSFDLGAMAGVGLEIGVASNISLVIDGFYNLGLTKIDDSGVDDDVKNRALSVLAGLSFSLGG